MSKTCKTWPDSADSQHLPRRLEALLARPETRKTGNEQGIWAIFGLITPFLHVITRQESTGYLGDSLFRTNRNLQ